MAGPILHLTAIAAALSLGAPVFHDSPDHLYKTGNESVGTPLVFVPPTLKTPAPGESNEGDESTVTPTRPTVTTQAIVGALSQVTAFCRGISQGDYVVDCLAERLGNVSRRLARTSGNEEIRESLAQASRSLNQIAVQNRARGKPRATFASPGDNGVRTERPLVPVDPARSDQALAEALAVIDSTETLLLRSASRPGADANRFQQVAQAIGSNKVLLRSL